MFAFEMDNNYNAAATVKSYAAKGIHAGTAVTRAILDRLGSPDEKLKIIRAFFLGNNFGFCFTRLFVNLQSTNNSFGVVFGYFHRRITINRF